MAETMTDAEAALEWQRFAEMDLNSAEFLLKMRPIPIEVICFHCQQSAEKSLKSILVFRSIFPPKTHYLQELMKTLRPLFNGNRICCSTVSALESVQCSSALSPRN